MKKRIALLFLASAGLLLAQQTPVKKEFHRVLPPGTQSHENVAYVEGGVPNQTLDLYLPANATGKLPVVVWIHGGAWRSGSKGGWCPALGLLSRGYAVADISYRLSWADNAPFPAQINDCKAAIRWLRANAATYGLDPDHIGVWGHSAGGHLVALLGVTGKVAALEGDEGNLQYSSAVQAVCDWSGPTDIVPKYLAQASNPKDMYVQLLGGRDMKAASEEKAAQASPLTYVSAGAAPFLIMHGTVDPVVPPADSEKLDAALKAAGVESTYVPVPGVGHGIGGPALEAQADDFFDRHLKPGATAAPVPAR
jgi:acetyl esterase/lipase